MTEFWTRMRRPPLELGQSDLEKFRARFMRFVTPEPMSGCWLWTAALADNGYGRFWIGWSTGNGRVWQSHRAAMLLFGCIDPRDQCVCHRCDNRACVNPDHLFLGTYTDNNRDMTRKGRHGYGGRPGERSHMAKLSNAQVVEIRELIASGVKRREIAPRFGVSRSTVDAIASGQNWASVR